MADHPAAQALTARQQRELHYHRDFARANETHIRSPLDQGLIASPRRRWWNHYWDLYSHFQRLDLRGKTVLVDGCGFGADALALATMGATVTGNDLSPESVAIAQARADILGFEDIQFDVGPCEALPYADRSFDMVVLIDILHHVDIARALAECRRVLKPGGRIVISEPYTHNFLQRNIRESRLVRGLLYPLLKRFIYQTDQPYITADERKLSEVELDYISSQLHVDRRDFFYILLTRIVPSRFRLFAKIDRLACKAIGPLGRYLSGRFTLTGTCS